MPYIKYRLYTPSNIMHLRLLLFAGPVCRLEKELLIIECTQVSCATNAFSGSLELPSEQKINSNENVGNILYYYNISYIVPTIYCAIYIIHIHLQYIHNVHIHRYSNLCFMHLHIVYLYSYTLYSIHYTTHYIVYTRV